MFARLFALLPLVLLVVACDPHCPIDTLEGASQGVPKDTPKDTSVAVSTPKDTSTPPVDTPKTTPTPPETGNTTATQCNTGSVSCCNQVQTIDQCTQILKDHDLLDVAASLGALVGLDCSPIDVLGVGSGCQVSQQPVCCENNQFNGLVNVGCTPINLQL